MPVAKRKLSCGKSARVGIIMLNSPNLPAYAHYATLVNYMYAAKHGYGFMVMRCPDPQDVGKDWAWDGQLEYKFVWSKGRMLAHALDLFDVVLFLDSDAVVWDDSVTVESKVGRLMGPQTCLVMAEDCKNSSWCYNQDKVNAGVILARRSPRMAEIIDAWMDPDASCPEFKYEHPREQACIDILRKKRFGDFIRKVPVEEMNGADGTWVRHYMGTSGPHRERLIRAHLDAVLAELPPPESPSGSARAWTVAALLALSLVWALLRLRARA
jgi:hypothetical protein